jgi:hypothetical protein
MYACIWNFVYPGTHAVTDYKHDEVYVCTFVCVCIYIYTCIERYIYTSIEGLIVYSSTFADEIINMYTACMLRLSLS